MNTFSFGLNIGVTHRFYLTEENLEKSLYRRFEKKYRRHWKIILNFLGSEICKNEFWYWKVKKVIEIHEKNLLYSKLLRKRRLNKLLRIKNQNRLTRKIYWYKMMLVKLCLNLFLSQTKFFVRKQFTASG